MSSRGTEWRVLSRRLRPEEPPRGLDALWDGAAGAVRRTRLRPGRFLAQAARVVAREAEIAALTDDGLREVADRLRERFCLGRETGEDLERAAAVVRESARRHLGEQPYLEQIAGGLAMHSGCVFEMATGEGKTLAAVLPAVLAAWRGRGCHVVTVNDYLARRDALWMGATYRFLGLRAAGVVHGMPPAERRSAYAAHITYVSNKEVAADFLRDRLAAGPRGGLASALVAETLGSRGASTRQPVQRGLECAIVDEADSILVDEAVTPLLLSGEAPNPGHEEAVRTAGDLAAGLESSRDYRVDPRYREVELTPAGRERLRERSASFGGIWVGDRRREEMVVQALTARHCYERDRHYVVRDDKVVIVDEFTGRLMPDRTWRHGFHQAVEGKEQVTVNLPKDTLARISFQRFFRLYRRLCGMTGTAWEIRRELWHVYRLPVVVIPVHRPTRRGSAPDRVFVTSEARWNAVRDEVRRLHETGRPVLVGTRSIGASQRLSRMLAEAKIEHQVLNGVQDADEAVIVGRAGQRGFVTVATNMAGRGTDIRLGPGVAEIGGLAVIATERHEARRIDRQLFGRSARQGDPGSVQAFASLEDDLVLRFAPLLAAALARLYRGGGSECRGRAARHLVAWAQRRAEAAAARSRRAVLASDHSFDEMLGFSGVGGDH